MARASGRAARCAGSPRARSCRQHQLGLGEPEVRRDHARRGPRRRPAPGPGARRRGSARRPGRCRSSRRGCPAGRRRSPGRRGRAARRRRSSERDHRRLARCRPSARGPRSSTCGHRRGLYGAPWPTYTSRALVARRAPARRRRGTREVSMAGSADPSVVPAPRAALALTPPSALPPARLAAERRGPGRLRDLRVGPQGRDAEPRAGRPRAREPPEDAPPRRQRRRRGRRLRPAGRHPAQDLGRGGPRRAATTRRSRSTPRSPSPTSSSSAPQDLEKARHDAREILGRGGFRILAERVGRGRLAGARARPRARRSRTSGSSPACVPDADRRDRDRLRPDGRARGGARRATSPPSRPRPASTR